MNLDIVIKSILQLMIRVIKFAAFLTMTTWNLYYIIALLHSVLAIYRLIKFI